MNQDSRFDIPCNQKNIDRHDRRVSRDVGEEPVVMYNPVPNALVLHEMARDTNVPGPK